MLEYLVHYCVWDRARVLHEYITAYTWVLDSLGSRFSFNLWVGTRD